MSDMLGYIGRRFANLLVVIWIAGTLNFVIPRLIPGDPVEAAFNSLAVRGGQTNVDLVSVKKAYEEKLGLNATIPEQYAHYWLGIASADFGTSIDRFPAPVAGMIASAIPWTIGLLGVATLVAFLIGTLLGALLGWPTSPRVLRALAPVFMILSAMPYYLLAILLIAVLAIGIHAFPAAGGYSPTLVLGWNMKSALDVLSHALLPALSIVLGAIGFWALGMRALMIGVLGEDQITYAESKGLSRFRIFMRYGLRNALLPQVTALSIALGTVVSGSVLVEAIFNYPGLGGLLFKSIIAKDIFVVNGIVTILILTLAVAVFAIDLILPILDPRIRRQA
jgi:peptide/nickel transport system permease protein